MVLAAAGVVGQSDQVTSTDTVLALTPVVFIRRTGLLISHPSLALSVSASLTSSTNASAANTVDALSSVAFVSDWAVGLAWRVALFGSFAYLINKRFSRRYDRGSTCRRGA